MNTLVLGLYAEGRTDERFLPVIIKRTAEDILIRYDRGEIETLDPLLIETPSDCAGRTECILYAARATYGYHALVVHADADGPDHKQALLERFEPGNVLVQQEQANVCKDLIPIIPVRMVEAWMLADPEALQYVLKTNVQNLNVPARAKLVESDTDPKETLKSIIRTVYPHQSRSWNKIRGELYGKLASKMNLDRLGQVPSYRQFLDDLTTALKKLNLIQ